MVGRVGKEARGAVLEPVPDLCQNVQTKVKTNE